MRSFRMYIYALFFLHNICDYFSFRGLKDKNQYFSWISMYVVFVRTGNTDRTRNPSILGAASELTSKSERKEANAKFELNARLAITSCHKIVWSILVIIIEWDWQLSYFIIFSPNNDFLCDYLLVFFRKMFYDKKLTIEMSYKISLHMHVFKHACKDMRMYC